MSKKPENIFSSLSCILIILKLFGAYPIAKYNEFKQKNRLELLETTYMIVLLIAYYILFGFAFKTENEAKEINIVINTAISIGYLSSITTIIITNIKNRHVFIKIMNQFDKIDKFILYKTNMNMEYRKVFIGTLAVTLIITFILFQSAISDYVILVVQLKTGNTWKWIILFIPLFIITYYHAFISILGYLLYQRFKLVNNCLKYLYLDNWTKILINKPKVVWTKTKGSHTNIDFYIDAIRNIKIVNEQLRKQANDICSCFSLPILTCSGTAFLVITVQIYYLIMLTRPEKTDGDKPTNTFEKFLSETRMSALEIKIKTAYCLINLILIHLIQFVSIVTSFHYVKEELDKTSGILNGVMMDFEDKEITRELSYFTLQLFNHPVVFSIYSVFNLSFEFLHTMAGTIITYLLILVQLRNQDGSTGGDQYYRSGVRP